MKIRFPCPACETPGRLDTPAPAGQSLAWTCPRCDHLTRLDSAPDPALTSCALCGGHELYKRKDFPQWLGMGVLVAACLASTVAYFFYDKYLTWAILIGSALFDGLLYLWVKDVVVCYRCNAHFHGVPAGPAHPPFELTLHERYRQERLRRQELTSGDGT